MTRKNSSKRDFKQRDVVDFVYLHLDSATISERPSHKKDHFIYEVEGKARPMLICSDPRRGRGGNWYRVFPLTTKKRKTDRIRNIGRSIDPDRNSYIFIDPEWYPENLVSKQRRSPRTTLERLGFDNIMQIAGHPRQFSEKNHLSGSK